MPPLVVDAQPAAVAVAKPAPPGSARWTVLLAMAFAMYGSYYAFDAIGPLAPLLTRQLQFSDSQIGLLQASYSLPNIFVLLAAGMFIDRVGARKSMLAFGGIIFVGLIVTAWNSQLGVMPTGRLILAAGADSL